MSHHKLQLTMLLMLGASAMLFAAPDIFEPHTDDYHDHDDPSCRLLEKKLFKQVQRWADKTSSQLAQQKARIDRQDKTIADLMATVASLVANQTPPSVWATSSPSASESPLPSPSSEASMTSSIQMSLSSSLSRSNSRSHTPSPSRSPPPYPSPPPADQAGNMNTTFVGNITLTGSQDTSQLAWLRYITRVEGSVAIADSDMQMVDLFDSLQEITGNLVVQLNQQLMSVEGLFRLRWVGGDVFVWKNAELKTLDGLQSLEAIGGQLQIRNNAKLEDVLALVSLQEVKGSVAIFKNDKLSEVSGFESLTSVGGNLEIAYNGALKMIEIEPLDYWRVKGSVTISSNDVLTDVVLTVNRTGDISFTGSAQLKRITFDQLERASAISVVSLPNLVSINFPNLHQVIVGSFQIHYCLSLPSISLPSLTHIGGSMGITVNLYGLKEISAPLLAVVSGSLDIYFNYILTSVVMGSLTRVGTVYIGSNSQLMSLDFLSSLAQQNINVPGGSANVGSITIEGNGVNCVNWFYVLFCC